MPNFANRYMDINKYVDSRGKLVKFDFLPNFSVKGFFIVADSPLGLIRGQHAHKKSSQIFFLIRGKVKVMTYFEGKWKNQILHSTFQYINIPRLTWINYEFLEKDTQIMVFTDSEYDKDEYITDFSLVTENL